MKQLILILTIFLSHSTFALRPDARVNKLIWGCSMGGNSDAVLVYQTDESYKHSSEMVLFIGDLRICDALNISCPYEGGIYQGMSYYKNFNGRYIYKSTKGKYADGVIFYSEFDGMKLNSLYTGSNPSVNWEKNWFFRNGECLKSDIQQ